MAGLRVATWNCQHGRPMPARVGEAVAELDVDVLAMQEVDRNTERVGHRDLAVSAQEAFGGELLWAPALILPGGGEYGNALLVRGELQDSEVIALPGRRRGRGSEPRVAAVTRATIDGQRWTLANTHLSTVNFVAADQLSYLLDVLRSWPAPRVLLGDLNLQPDLLLPWLSAESYKVALGPLTHPAHRPRRQIDHVAVSGHDCAVVPWEALQLVVGDHRALFAEVTRPD
jgi:endonuclease/exonuclease/phosphatase family metal-dependent hydrolase